MLKNIPPLLTPDALHALASMGHGDDVAIVDANFPGASTALHGGARLVQLSGCNSPKALAAVLQLLPLDSFVPDAAWTMQVVGDAASVPAPVAEFSKLLEQAGERPALALERFDFYERARGAFAIFQTGELRKYGNIILRKGVLASDVAADANNENAVKRFTT
ncbi:RbsD/FucU family protein [soil metagenome]